MLERLKLMPGLARMSKTSEIIKHASTAFSSSLISKCTKTPLQKVGY